MKVDTKTGWERKPRPIYIGGIGSTDIRSRQDTHDLRRTEGDDPRKAAFLDDLAARRRAREVAEEREAEGDLARTA